MRLLGNSHRWLPVAAFVLLLYLIQGVARQRPFAYDGPLLLAIHRYSTPTLDRLMLAITQVGHPDTLVAIALITLAALLLRRRWPTCLSAATQAGRPPFAVQRRFCLPPSALVACIRVSVG